MDRDSLLPQGWGTGRVGAVMLDRTLQIGLLAIGAWSIAVGGSTPAVANMFCVQEELSRIGLDPGPVDGRLGKRTVGAARTYQTGAMYLPDLSADTSYIWCRALRGLPPSGMPGTVESSPVPAIEGATAAAGTTPILGETPEYQVPGWVNNPH